MSKHITISDLPEKYQRSAYAQLCAGNLLGPKVAQAPAPNAKARTHAAPIRQRTNGDGLNRWERQFLAKLKADFPRASIYREISLPLANGVRYKPDFIVGSIEFDRPIGYEVKGQRRAAGIAKLKVAATLYPWISFYIVTREKPGGAWQCDRVHP